MQLDDSPLRVDIISKPTNAYERTLYRPYTYYMLRPVMWSSGTSIMTDRYIEILQKVLIQRTDIKYLFYIFA